MLSGLLTKKKVIGFAIKHWKEILLVAFLCAVIGKSRIDYMKLQKTYEVSQQSLTTQLNSLKDQHAEELRRRDEALVEYRETLQQLEERYLRSQAELGENRNNERDEIIEEIVARDQFSQNKEELAARIEDVLGLSYVP
jgi:DNA anti-recombination protein RmuC